MDDSKIIEIFFERSEQAITELSAKYGAICLHVAENILGNRQDAEECVADAYLAVWNTIPPQRPELLRSYILRIVRNLSLKKYHENTAQKRNSHYDIALEEIQDCFSSPSSVDKEIEAEQIARVIDRFLEGLDRPDRIMFVRRYWYGDSMGDLAGLLHKSRHYISVRLSRLRKSLKQFLTEEGVVL